jgi:hypothetical protein
MMIEDFPTLFLWLWSLFIEKEYSSERARAFFFDFLKILYYLEIFLQRKRGLIQESASGSR